MYPNRVEVVQQLHKIINVHGSGTLVLEARICQDLFNEFLDLEILVNFDTLH